MHLSLNPLRQFLALSGLAALFCASAHAEIRLTDDVAVVATATAAVRYDSNIFLDASNGQGDFIGSFTPGLALVYGQGGNVSGNLYARNRFDAYSSHGDQDASLPSFGLEANYAVSKTELRLAASRMDVAQNNQDTRGLGLIVRRRLTDLDATGKVALTQKTEVASGASFHRIDYGPAFFTDSRNWLFPVDVYYHATPLLDWSAGMRYRDTDLSGTGVDSHDVFYNIGARGEFTAKLTGQIRVGFGERKFTGGGKSRQLVLDSSLSYALSAKTVLDLTASNDASNAGNGDPTENLSVAFTASNRLSAHWSSRVGLTYRRTQYPLTTDDLYEGTASVSYAPSSRLGYSAFVTVSDNRSALRGFTGSVIGLSADLRY